jgi:hypothetical protein
VTLEEAARELQVSNTVVKRLIRERILVVSLRGIGSISMKRSRCKSDPVEKPQRSRGHQPAVHGHLPVLGQIELVFPNVFRV